MKPLQFEIYKGKDGYRWKLKASNGKILADSGEAYKRKKRAKFIIDKIIKVPSFIVIDKTEKK